MQALTDTEQLNIRWMTIAIKQKQITPI
uniref:Uncharacterized protein n=1 Tax=Rhizophora mucronata TaxID=61149 RepID=A0A2P2QJ51_RHIMU